MIQKVYSITIGLLLLVFIFGACDKDTLVAPEQEFRIEVISAAFPDTVWTKSDYDILATAHIIASKDALPSLTGLIRFKDPQETPVTIIFHNDGMHGDNIPGDAIYTVSIGSTVFGQVTGDGFFEILAPIELDNSDPDDLLFSKDVFFADGYLNTAPVSVLESAPDSLSISAGAIAIITIKVNDEQGLEDITRVTGDLYAPFSPIPNETIIFLDDGAGNDLASGDGVFSGVISYDIIETAGPGEYTLLAQAVDQAGNGSNEIIHSIVFTSDANNLPPGFIAVTVPDSIEANNSLIVLMAAVDDPNGLHDIDKVFFFSVKPDKTLANNGNPFFLFDDGSTIFRGGVLSGDQVEGDGIYTLTIIIPPETVKGEFVFKFRVSDNGGLDSQFSEHPVIVH
jgi:hypothetical protein